MVSLCHLLYPLTAKVLNDQVELAGIQMPTAVECLNGFWYVTKNAVTKPIFMINEINFVFMNKGRSVT
jgi:hypothetical protein